MQQRHQFNYITKTKHHMPKNVVNRFTMQQVLTSFRRWIRDCWHFRIRLDSIVSPSRSNRIQSPILTPECVWTEGYPFPPPYLCEEAPDLLDFSPRYCCALCRIFATPKSIPRPSAFDGRIEPTNLHPTHLWHPSSWSTGCPQSRSIDQQSPETKLVRVPDEHW